eukprot:NODE_6986_length_802_cov_73.412371_g6749_i0.p1 GENE.NODE_6986_length_802_cov_73.412371_g6749_i0~~NODE_6986_length_802_cov_73.412371_g6749_i0.p1  ORF type:complete len:183 (-),score=6.33 NODE_6986_length_802_cov_73.412371_g6749_i0:159-707(-)
MRSTHIKRRTVESYDTLASRTNRYFASLDGMYVKQAVRRHLKITRAASAAASLAATAGNASSTKTYHVSSKPPIPKAARAQEKVEKPKTKPISPRLLNESSISVFRTVPLPDPILADKKTQPVSRQSFVGLTVQVPTYTSSRLAHLENINEYMSTTAAHGSGNRHSSDVVEKEFSLLPDIKK